MRFIEITGGLQTPVSNEELELVNKIKESKQVLRTKLDEREQELARKLVSRGVLRRIKKDDSSAYEFNGLNDVWRDKHV